MKKILSILFTTLILLTTATVLAEDAYTPIEEGKEIGDFTVQLLDGTDFVMSEQRGKAVLINIWATWCGPCVSEMPDIQKLSETYADDLMVLGLNCGEDEASVLSFVTNGGYNYAFALDENYLLIDGLFPTQYIPYSVFVSPEGVVTSTITGSADYEAFVAEVEKALSR